MSLNVLYAVCTVNDLQLIISEQSLAGGKSKGKSAQNFRKTCTDTHKCFSSLFTQITA